MSELERPICPWCQTEIVWDEEIGPERFCPHCENELSGYRTMQIGLDQEEEEDTDDDEPDDRDTDWDDELDEDSDDEYGEETRDLTGLRRTSRERLALDETMESLLEDQLEVPECPSCREYMLEAGTQTIDDTHFRPRTPSALNEPLLVPPFRTVLYVCPSCFHTENRLEAKDQERLVRVLASAVKQER